jgi:hypothetical protein
MAYQAMDVDLLTGQGTQTPETMHFGKHKRTLMRTSRRPTTHAQTQTCCEHVKKTAENRRQKNETPRAKHTTTAPFEWRLGLLCCAGGMGAPSPSGPSVICVYRQKRTTLGGAQAPTHSFPLRLAPAGTYWRGPPRRQQQKQSRRRPTHAPTKQQPTRRTTTTRTTTTKPNHKLLSATRPQPRRRDGGDTTGHAPDPFGYLAHRRDVGSRKSTLAFLSFIERNVGIVLGSMKTISAHCRWNVVEVATVKRR